MTATKIAQYRLAYKYSDGSIVFIDSPYFVKQIEKIGKKKIYSLEDILSLGYSKTKNNRITKCKPNTFVELSRMGRIMGGEHPGWYYYGVVKISEEMVKQHDNLEEIEKAYQFAKSKIEKNPEYQEFKKLQDTFYKTRKSLSSLKSKNET